MAQPDLALGQTCPAWTLPWHSPAWPRQALPVCVDRGPALVFGPFMAPARRETFWHRLESLDKVEAITFDSRVEHLIEGAQGVVAMGGYNTFCEILSFDKRAVIVPRRVPRREQWIRASAAEQMGLIRMLSDEHGRDPARMSAALRELPSQPLPSTKMPEGMLDGLERIQELVEEQLPASVSALSA